MRGIAIFHQGLRVFHLKRPNGSISVLRAPLPEYFIKPLPATYSYLSWASSLPAGTQELCQRRVFDRQLWRWNASDLYGRICLDLYLLQEVVGAAEDRLDRPRVPPPPESCVGVSSA